MTQIKLASLWAVALLGSALAARFGVTGEAMAEGLFFGLLMGAGVSLAQAAGHRSC